MFFFQSERPFLLACQGVVSLETGDGGYICVEEGEGTGREKGEGNKFGVCWKDECSRSIVLLFLMSNLGRNAFARFYPMGFCYYYYYYYYSRDVQRYTTVPLFISSFRSPLSARTRNVSHGAEVSRGGLTLEIKYEPVLSRVTNRAYVRARSYR